MLADGKILVQRYGDILDGKRTWEKALAVQRPPDAQGCRRGRYHRRVPLPLNGQHHQLYSGHG